VADTDALGRALGAAADRPVPAPHAALRVSRAERAGRRKGLGEAREPPADRRLQGPRGRQPGLTAGRRGAPARRSHRLDRQPRPVDLLRGAPLRRSRGRVRARGRQPVACERASGRAAEHGRDFDEARENPRRWRPSTATATSTGQRAAPDRRRRTHTLEILEEQRRSTS
jgi:hypothetical protein